MTTTAALRRAHLTRQAANRQIAEIASRFIPPAQWGPDHLTTLLYLETCCVDQRGRVDDRKMRGRNPNYPTRLKDGEEVSMHSDYDCIDDMIIANYVERTSGDRYRLTDKGWAEAWKLRRARAENALDANPE